MKKSIFYLFLFILIFNFHFLNAENKDSGGEDKGKGFNKPTLGQLINLEKEAVKNYKSYKFEVTWLDGKPLINIAQENKNTLTNKVNLRVILLVEPKKSIYAQTKTLLALTALQIFKTKKVLLSNDKNHAVESDGTSLLRFDSYDSQNRIRSSEWRVPQNGFQVEEELFNENGTPLGMTYYFRVKINDDSPLDYSGPLYTLPLGDAVERFGPVDFEDSKDVIKFSAKLLERALFDASDGK